MNKTVRVAFLGDSVTEGCFELYPTSYGFDTVRRPEDGYVAKAMKTLRKVYGEQVIEYENFAESGASAFTATEQLEKALAYAPDVVVLSFGLNDAFHPEERYTLALRKLFERLTSVVPNVIFVTPNMMCEYISPDILPESKKAAEKAMDAQTSGKFDRMIESSIELCNEYNTYICHMYAVWKDMRSMGCDTTSLLINGINHPDAAMQSLTAYELLPYLEAAFNDHWSDERFSSKS